MNFLELLDYLNTKQMRESNSLMKLYLHTIILIFQIQGNFNFRHEFTEKIFKENDFKISLHWNSLSLKKLETYWIQILKSFQNFSLQTTRLNNERRQQDHPLDSNLQVLQTLISLRFYRSKLNLQLLDWSLFRPFEQPKDL